MTRPKTISDEDLLAVARRLFQAQGHNVTTRQVAEAAGISEAILYQRFGNKDEMFFAAMAPGAPDLEEVLGPVEVPGPPRDYLRGVLERLADYFGEVLPLAVRLITHPSFDQRSLGRANVTPQKLHAGLVLRLASLERAGALRKGAADPLAQLLIHLAHDWALGKIMSPRSAARKSAERTRDLHAMVDLVWTGASAPKR